MRTALKTDPDWQTHATNAAPPPLGVMESFASLRTAATSSSSLGGYLVLRRPGSQLHARARARFPKRGHVLRGGILIGGLVVASLYLGAFAHPDVPADVASAQNKLRYAPQAAEPGSVLAAMVGDPDTQSNEGKPDTSFATSAIAPARQPLGEALPEKIEPLADAPPQPLKLAEAPTPDELSTVAPDPITAAPVEDPLPTSETVEKPTVRPAAHGASKPAHRRVRHQRAPARRAKAPAAKADALTVARAPRWAQQMYATPWQSQAFSYVR